MRDTPLPEGAPRDEASLAACVATILEQDGPPGTVTSLGPWLAARGLGLVPIREPAAFSWAGPWLARVRGADGTAAHVVRFGVPSGTAWDPAGVGAGAIEAGWVIAALDPRRTPTTRDTPISGSVAGLSVAARREGPCTALEAVGAIPGVGLAGDRYALGQGTFPSPGDGAALTLIAREILDAFVPPLGADEHRRNVVTVGVDLDALIGRRFRLGDVLCAGRRRAEPCAHLERLATRPLLRPLVHRGGLRADILSAGTIRVGDAIRPA